MFDLTKFADWIQANVLYIIFISAAASAAIGVVNKKIRDAMLIFGGLMLVLVIVVVAHNIDGIIAWFSGFVTPAGKV